MLADLARSGLTPKEIDAELLSPAQLGDVLNRLGKRPNPLEFGATYFPYYDINGALIPDHAALRFAASKAQLERAQLPKYFTFDPTAEGYVYTAPRFYLALTLKEGWTQVAKDPAQPIIFTEGQKKAAAACKQALATIGLEGVDNFLRRGERQPFQRGRTKSVALDDFDLFVWPEREAWITYDSDIDYKPQGREAARRLAALTSNLGAKPSLIRLRCSCKPPCKGFDDFLLKHGADEFRALARTPFDEVDRVGARYVKLAKPAASVYDRALRDVIPHGKFLTNAASFKTIDPMSGRQIDAAKVWSSRTEPASRLLFDPAGAPESFVPDPQFAEQTAFNRYRPPFVAPKKGDISLYLELLAHGFPDKAERLLFEKWAAYPLQNPGAKINYAVLMLGQKGIGKTWLGTIIGALYGEYYRFIDKPESVHEKFNSAFANKLFSVVEEVVHSRVEAERLKGFITSETIEIEPKGLEKYSIEESGKSLFEHQFLGCLED